MQLISYRVLHCFGFRDSGRVNLKDAQNLIYILGRNSSGKTSFLTALGYISLDRDPQRDPNYRNFNSAGEVGQLIAGFTVQPGELSVETFAKQYQDSVALSPSKDGAVTREPTYRQRVPALIEKLQGIYQDLIRQAEQAGNIWVRRLGDGHYEISAQSSFSDVKARQQQINQALQEVFPAMQMNFSGAMRSIPLSTEEVDGVLYRQMPHVVWFSQDYTLADSLPERITREHLNPANQNGITRAFISYLGQSTVQRYLEAESSRERRELEARMQARVDALTDDVNRARAGQGNHDLIRMVLEGGDGLHISVITDERESWYRLISDNTKFLFAYYLYRLAYAIQGTILLFDEPTNGFHATAQDQLLNFLLDLGEQGNLVVVSTHSEYLIDPDHLSGVRLMSTDASGYLCIRNHYYGALEANTSADFFSLRPITDAIGLRFGSSKLQIHDKVVVTEGITDMLYLRAFHAIFAWDKPVYIAPGSGDTKLLPIISLLISQQFRFKLIVDSRRKKDNIKAVIQGAYDIPGEFFWEVPIPEAFQSAIGSGIEDLFSKADFKKLLERLGILITEEFDGMSNSEYLKRRRLSTTAESAPKRIVAHYFYEHVQDYHESDFDDETRANFRAALMFSTNNTWFPGDGTALN